MMSQQLTGNLDHMRLVRSAMGNGAGRMVEQFDEKGMPFGETFVPGNEFWAQGTGGFSSLDSDGNGAGYDRNAWGAAVGYERSFTKSFTMGLALAYENARVELENPAAPSSRYDSDNFYVDLYAMWNKGPWQMRGLVGFNNADYTMNRFVSIAPGTDGAFAKSAHGSTTGTAVNLAYELSYDFTLNETTILQPLFTVESSYNSIDGFAESGSIGNAGLVVDDQDAWMTVLGAGARIVKDFRAFDNAPMARFQFRALVTASVGDQNTSVDASFRGAPNARYTLTPADQKRVGCLVGADLTLPVTQRAAVFAGGTAEFKGGDNNYTANLGVRYSF